MLCSSTTKRAKRFFEADEKHVLAVHCKAGKGRTGVMICAYLLYASAHAEPEQALHFFRSARTTDLDAVNNPSQEAYVRLYAALLAAPPAAVPKLLSGPQRRPRLHIQRCPSWQLRHSRPTLAASPPGR